MKNLLIRLIINAAALWAAASLVPGVTLARELGGVLVVALIFGVVNALIKPIFTLLAFPLILITLGLATVAINALMLMLTAHFSADLEVDGFGAALVGALVVSIVSIFMTAILRDESERR